MKTKLLLLLALLCATFLVQAQSEEEKTSPLMSGKGFPKAVSPEERNPGGATMPPHRRFDEEVSSSETSPARGNAITEIAEKPAASLSKEDKLEEIKREMQGFIETTATLHTATDLLERTEAVRTFLQNQHPDIDWNSKRAIDAFVRTELLNNYKRQVALALRHEHQQAPLSQELQDEQKIAEDFRIDAKRLRIELENIKQSNFSPENLLAACSQLVTAWNKTFIAYEFLLAKAEALQITTEPFQETAREAKLETACAQAQFSYLSASQREQQLQVSQKAWTIDEAIMMKELWKKVLIDGEEGELLANATIFEIEKKEARERVAFWMETIKTSEHQKEASYQREQQKIQEDQQKQFRKNLSAATLLFEKATQETATSNQLWQAFHEKRTSTESPGENLSPQFHTPLEVLLQSAKETLELWNRTEAAYQLLGDLISLNDLSWKERLEQIERQRADWNAKIRALQIDPPYQLDPGLEEFKRVLSRKAWREEGAVYEAFQAAAVAKALAGNREAHAVNRLQLDQELKEWNKNAAHEFENKKRWAVFRNYRNLKLQAQEARTERNKLKRKGKERSSEITDESGSEVDVAVPARRIRGTKSEASTDTGSSLSTVSSLEIQRLDKIIAASNKAEEEWIRLANKANEQRERYGGIVVSHDYSTFATAWYNADEEVIQAEDEKAEQADRLAREARMKINWKNNKARWDLYEEILQSTITLNNSKTTLEQLEEEQHPSTKKEREKQSQEINEQTILLDAKKKHWEEQASQEPRLLALRVQQFSDPQEREITLRHALQRLERENKLICHFRAALAHERELEGKEGNIKEINYPEMLKRNKGLLLGNAFQKINQERFAIQEIVRKNKKPEALSEARRRYDLVVPQEQAALQSYQLLSIGQAIDAAIEAFPEASAAWNKRVEESEEKAKRQERARKHPETLPWNNSFEESPHGTDLIAQADRTAWEAFEREENYLKDIQKILKEELDFQEAIAFEKEKKAAMASIQGDSHPWKMLSPEERRHYNETLHQKRKEQLSAMEEILEDHFHQAIKALTDIQELNDATFTYYRPSTKKKIVERAEKQEVTLKHLIHLLSDPAHQATLDRALRENQEDENQEGLLLSLKKETQEKIKALFSSKEDASELPVAFAEDPSDPEAPLAVKDGAALLQCCTLLQEALTRNIAKRNQSNLSPLETEAQEVKAAANTAYDRAVKTPGEARFPLLDQAILLAEQAALLHERIFQARQELLQSASSSKKGEALYALETAQSNHLLWEIEVSISKTMKQQAITLDLCKKAEHAEGEQILPLWEEVLHSLQAVHQHNQIHVDRCRKRVSSVALRFQTGATKDLQKALLGQASWKVADLDYIAQKSQAVTEAAWERCCFLPHLEETQSKATQPLIQLFQETLLAWEKVSSYTQEQLAQAAIEFKIDWKRRIAWKEHPKIFYELWGEALKIDPRRAAEKERAWEKILQAAQERIEVMEAFLTEGERLKNFHFVNTLELLQNQKALAHHHAAWSIAMIAGERAHQAYQQWEDAFQSLYHGEETTQKREEDSNASEEKKRWNQVEEKLNETLEAWKAAVEKSKELLLREVPENFKLRWKKLIRSSKTQRALWEARVLWWDAEKKERAAQQALASFEKQDLSSPTAAALPERPAIITPQEKEERERAARLIEEVIEAWNQALDIQWEKATYAPDHLKPLWLENRDQAAKKKAAWEEKSPR